MSKQFKAAIQLLEKYRSIKMNVDWWMREMHKLDKELDLIPLIKDEDEREKYAEVMERKLDELSARGLHEIANIRDWDAEHKKFKSEKKEK